MMKEKKEIKTNKFFPRTRKEIKRLKEKMKSNQDKDEYYSEVDDWRVSLWMGLLGVGTIIAVYLLLR